MLDRLPCSPLGFFPTRLHELPRLSKALGGPRLLIKRDDLTGLAMGGNKTRKLEFLVGAALAQHCDTLVTGGAEQSNHCRQTAAAANRCGLECHLVLGGQRPENPNGNLLLDNLLGAHIHWTGELRKGERIPEIVEALRQAGRKPYIIPYGGSDTMGAMGFVDAVRELAGQLKLANETVSHIVFPSSSGGTHAGLIVGRRLFQQAFIPIGIGIDKDLPGMPSFPDQIVTLANATADRLGLAADITANEIVLRQDFVGAGYGVIGERERRAIHLLAQHEGILVDPVYSGRALGALITMIEQGEFSARDTVLFWHTGGVPALFAYAEALTSNIEQD